MPITYRYSYLQEFSSADGAKEKEETRLAKAAKANEPWACFYYAEREAHIFNRIRAAEYYEKAINTEPLCKVGLGALHLLPFIHTSAHFDRDLDWGFINFVTGWLQAQREIKEVDLSCNEKNVGGGAGLEAHKQALRTRYQPVVDEIKKSHPHYYYLFTALCEDDKPAAGAAASPAAPAAVSTAATTHFDPIKFKELIAILDSEKMNLTEAETKLSQQDPATIYKMLPLYLRHKKLLGDGKAAQIETNLLRLAQAGNVALCRALVTMYDAPNAKTEKIGFEDTVAKVEYLLLTAAGFGDVGSGYHGSEALLTDSKDTAKEERLYWYVINTGNAKTDILDATPISHAADCARFLHQYVVNDTKKLAYNYSGPQAKLWETCTKGLQAVRNNDHLAALDYYKQVELPLAVGLYGELCARTKPQTTYLPKAIEAYSRLADMGLNLSVDHFMNFRAIRNLSALPRNSQTLRALSQCYEKRANKYLQLLESQFPKGAPVPAHRFTEHAKLTCKAELALDQSTYYKALSEMPEFNQELKETDIDTVVAAKEKIIARAKARARSAPAAAAKKFPSDPDSADPHIKKDDSLNTGLAEKFNFLGQPAEEITSLYKMANRLLNHNRNITAALATYERAIANAINYSKEHPEQAPKYIDLALQGLTKLIPFTGECPEKVKAILIERLPQVCPVAEPTAYKNKELVNLVTAINNMPPLRKDPTLFSLIKPILQHNAELMKSLQANLDASKRADAKFMLSLWEVYAANPKSELELKQVQPLIANLKSLIELAKQHPEQACDTLISVLQRCAAANIDEANLTGLVGLVKDAHNHVANLKQKPEFWRAIMPLVVVDKPLCDLFFAQRRANSAWASMDKELVDKVSLSSADTGTGARDPRPVRKQILCHYAGFLRTGVVIEQPLGTSREVIVQAQQLLYRDIIKPTTAARTVGRPKDFRAQMSDVLDRAKDRLMSEVEIEIVLDPAFRGEQDKKVDDSAVVVTAVKKRAHWWPLFSTEESDCQRALRRDPYALEALSRLTRVYAEKEVAHRTLFCNSLIMLMAPLDSPEYNEAKEREDKSFVSADKNVTAVVEGCRNLRKEYPATGGNPYKWMLQNQKCGRKVQKEVVEFAKHFPLQELSDIIERQPTESKLAAAGAAGTAAPAKTLTSVVPRGAAAAAAAAVSVPAKMTAPPAKVGAVFDPKGKTAGGAATDGSMELKPIGAPAGAPASAPST